jgi:hypothetical protein
LHQYQKDTGSYPASSDATDKCIFIAKGLEGCPEEFDEAVLRNLFDYCKCSITPMAAFFGGIVA